MTLIPIPHEAVQNAVKTTKAKVFKQIRRKLREKEGARNEKILQKTCMQMTDYIVSKHNFDFEAVDGLIDNMHRSILTLQKRKRELGRNKKKK